MHKVSSQSKLSKSDHYLPFLTYVIMAAQSLKGRKPDRHQV